MKRAIKHRYSVWKVVVARADTISDPPPPPAVPAPAAAAAVAIADTLPSCGSLWCLAQTCTMRGSTRNASTVCPCMRAAICARCVSIERVSGAAAATARRCDFYGLTNTSNCCIHRSNIGSCSKNCRRCFFHACRVAAAHW